MLLQTVLSTEAHDKRFPAGLVVGFRFVVGDLPGLVSGAVGQLSDRWHAQAQRIDAYRRHELTDVQAHDLIVRALDNRAITITQVPAILKEWRVPRHPEFAGSVSL